MKQKQKLSLRLWLTALGFLLLGLFLTQFASCSSARVVEREVVRTHHDTLRVVDTRRDSIFHRDSVYLVERWMGDTLIREKTHEIIRYHDRTQHDTIVKVVVKEATQKVVKEKRKPWWYDLRLWLYIVAIAAVAATGYKVWRMLR